MKKLFLTLISLMFLSTIANAEPVLITDLHVDPSVLSGFLQPTPAFTTFAFNDQTISITNETSIDDIGIGTFYTDQGHGIVVDLRDANNVSVNNFSTGLGLSWSIWTDWTIYGEITSQESSPFGEIYHLSNITGTLNAYLTTPDGNFGAEQTPYDDTEPSIMIPMLSATVETNDSNGFVIYDENNDNVFRNLSIVFKVTSVNNDILYSDSIDLSDLVNKEWLFGLTTESAASGLTNWTRIGDAIAITASGTGSVQFGAVPEPASIILMGTSLIMIGIIGRRVYN